MQQIVKIQVKLSKRKIALIYAAILVEKAVHVVAKNIIKRSVEVVPVESKESTAKS